MRACGGDGGDGGTQAAAPPQPAKVTVTASATGDQVTFDVPAQIKPGATELTLVNKTKEQVEFQIVQLDEGHTLAEFFPALESDEGAIPPWLHALGGVGEASPGESRSTVVDLKAGSYARFSNTTPEQEGAEPLYKRGGEGSMEVTGDPTGPQLPATTAQITAKEVAPDDDQFEATGLKAGINQITFSNGGGRLHHAVIAGLADGATIDQAQEFFTRELQGTAAGRLRRLRDHRRARHRRQGGRDGRAPVRQLRPALLPHRSGRRPAARQQGQDDPGGEGPLARCATVGGRCS